MRPGGLIAVLAVCASAAWAGTAGAAETIPNRHQVEVLWVLDHHGRNPRGDADIRPYARPFNKIVTHCTISVDTLTNMTYWLADKASVMGGRRVTSLQMLQSIARRITWVAPRRPCAQIYDLAEGHLEAGDP
jgi:hypothetical protein